MKRFALSICILLTAAMAIWGKIDMPNFAFPKQVISQSKSTLAKSNSTQERLNALLAMYTAEQSIDKTYVNTYVKRIDSLANVSRSDSERALLLTLEAQLYNGYFESNLYNANKRDYLPLIPYPDNIAEWSGRQLKARIDSLSNAAWDLAKSSCADLAMSDYEDVLKADKLALIYFPTVKDFIGINVYQMISSKQQLLKDLIANARPQSPNWFYYSCIADNDYKKLYEDNADCEAARYALIKWCEASNTDENNDSLIAIVRKSLTDYPAFCQNVELKERLGELENPWVKCTYPSVVYPGKAFDISVKYQNADSVGFAVYKLTRKDKNVDSGCELTYFKSIGKQQTKVTNTSAPQTTKFSYTIDNEDEYYILAVVNGKTSNNVYHANKISCAKILIFNTENTKPTVIAAVDAVSGKPLEGAQIYHNKSAILGETNSDGLFTSSTALSSSYGNYLYLSKKDYSSRIYNITTYYYDRNGTKISKKETFGNILIDKPIYRPGDIVDWAAIITEGDGKGSAVSVAANRKITAQLRTPNYKVVNTLELSSDDNGRISGKFDLPTDGLTGNYSIVLNADNKKFATSSFAVSEYKMPTFEVTTTELKRDGAITICGKVQTFSQMPVSDATVSAKITAGNIRRYFSAEEEVTTIYCETDSEGNYSIVIPSEVIANEAANGRKCFNAAITATRADGETAEYSKRFNTGKPYVISLENEDDNIDGLKINVDNPIDLKFKAYDINGNAVDLELNYELYGSENKTIVARATSGKDNNWSKVPAGKYSLRIVPSDTTVCDTYDYPNRAILYSILKGTMPDKEALFTYTSKYNTDATGKATIEFGVSSNDTYVYSYLNYADKVSDLTVSKYSSGFKKLTYSIPDGYDVAQVTIVATKDCATYMQTIWLERPIDNKLNIKAEAFRDKLISGETETWHFTLSDSNDKPLEGAMIATMYNHSLDAITALRWNTRFSYYRESPIAGFDEYGKMLISDTHRLGELGHNAWWGINLPSYVYSDFWGRRTRYLGGRYLSANRNTLVADEVYAEAKMMSFAKAESADDDLEVEDLGAIMNTEDEAETEGVDEDETSTEFDYRDSNVTTAFWQPSLCSNDNGEVTLTFTVPNANTTWSMEAFAWTKDLKYGSLVRQFVSNKPVMVQANAPRYLRQGDKARVLATVFNNTDSAAVIASTIEIFNIADGKILQTATSKDALAAKQSAIVGIDIEAPLDLAMIGYRVRSINQDFSDGEQTFIPILASASTVVESELFYLNPGDKEYTLTVADAESSTNKLQYCANPIWSVVKTLHGINTDNQTVIGAAIALSGNSNAKYIADNNPQIARTIADWKAAPQDSALVSMLLRNNELKLADINETPWLQAADNANQRMAALDEIFDSKRVSSAIESSLKTLRDNQQADGGWRWASWCRESSQWITEGVLLRLKMAKAVGSLDKNADDMITRGMKFYDSKTKSANRTHALLHSIGTDYSYDLRTKQLISKEVQNIVKTWRKDGVAAKALDAIILHKNGYPALAKQIIASITEFGVEQPGKGMTYPSVSRVSDYAWIVCAFDMIAPNSPEIDKMRQWLIIQSQATDDLGACYPDYLVSAILMTGSKWLDADNSNTLIINGTAPQLNSVEAGTGYISTNVNAGDRITITPNGLTPSYGSVTAIARRKMTDIEAFENEDFKIEKRIIADGNYTDKLKLGQRVKVLLTITVNRNMEYVTIIDERPATLEPVDQLSHYIYTDGVSYYRENRDSSTRLFINYLRKGTYQISYDMTANLVGEYSSGIATLQSQYAPELTAHSSGMTITVE